MAILPLFYVDAESEISFFVFYSTNAFLPSSLS